MVIFIFLGRATDTLIPAVALPLSLLLTFIAMKLLGYSLDNLSLMALTLAIGFLVDDAIVFLENTVRLMEEGHGGVRGITEIGQGNQLHDSGHDAFAGGGVLPLVFMGGLMGRIFREFSITIVISILASGLVSLTLTPLMTSRLLSNRGAGAKKTWMERVFGAHRAPRAGCLRPLAVVLPSPSLDLGRDLGRLPGGNRRSCSTSCPSRSCRWATARSSAA